MPTLTNWLNNHSQHKVRAIIDSILPEDAGEFILISGRTGIGKSILASNIAINLIQGKAVYGFACQEVSAAYIAMEGGNNDWRKRWELIKAANPEANLNNLIFELTEPMNLLIEKKRNELKAMCGNSKVIIIDNLRQITTGKYLDPAYAADWLKAFQSMLKELNAVGIVTHHIRKRDERYTFEPDDVYQLKGATEYVDTATSVLLLERRKHEKDKLGHFLPIDNNKLILYFAKHRIASEEMNGIKLLRNFDKCRFDLEYEGVDRNGL